jgi:hypothetical protein
MQPARSTRVMSSVLESSDTGSETCEIFNATFCQAPIDATCFSDWYNLSQALDTARNLGKGSVFKLCEDSLLKADPFNPIELDVDGTVIQCGEKGVLTDRWHHYRRCSSVSRDW